MTAPKRYTEREMVLAKREASAKARCAALWSELLSDPHIAWLRDGACVECWEKAAERYPLPQIERPRVWSDPASGLEYRVVDGKVQTRFIAHGDSWQASPSGRLFAAVADLLVTPRELVPDDGSVSDTPPAGAET